MTKQRIFLKKTLINDLTFRMSQHTSSEVTVGYNTIREKDWDLIMTVAKEKLIIYRPILSLLENI